MVIYVHPRRLYYAAVVVVAITFFLLFDAILYEIFPRVAVCLFLGRYILFVVQFWFPFPKK